MSGALLREQMVKRGRYIAAEPRLQQQVRRAHRGQAAAHPAPRGRALRGHRPRASGTSDVVGAMIRDAKGAMLAQRGARHPRPALAPRPRPSRSATPSPSRASPVILFRAPGDQRFRGRDGHRARPRRRGRRASGGGAEGRSGGRHQQVGDGRAAEEGLPGHERSSPSSSSPAGSALGWFLIGRWLKPVRRMLDVANAVTKGDLTEQGRDGGVRGRAGRAGRGLQGHGREPAQDRGQHPGDVRPGRLLRGRDLRQREAHHPGRAEPGPGRGGDVHLDGGDGGVHPDRGRQRAEPGHLRRGDLVARSPRWARPSSRWPSPARPWPAP